MTGWDPVDSRSRSIEVLRDLGGYIPNGANVVGRVSERYI